MSNLIQVSYAFPTFSLLVTHDESFVLNAQFQPLSQQSAAKPGKSDLTRQIIAELDAYCLDAWHQFNLPLKLNGTLHQLKLWQLMRQIPAGSTLTYGSAAALINSAARATGGACSKNPLPVFIPCHRIIAANNRLGGFNSGNIFFNLDIKKWLLAHEGVYVKA